MELKVIAYARNGHSDKFGIPRQSREESPILTRIVFEPEYSVPEALRGIEGYSHLWLIWGFSENRPQTTEHRAQTENEWSPTVRPPRLGGNKRMGVFATRSPFRPNPLGLSSVRLVGIVENGKLSGISESRNPGIPKEKGSELIVSGADLMDGTPIYDIKPYLSFSDSHEEALNGFAEEHKDTRLEVDWNGKSLGLPRDDKEAITYLLAQDPRPGYQDDPQREYKLDYAGWNVTFRVEGKKVYVLKLEKLQ